MRINIFRKPSQSRQLIRNYFKPSIYVRTFKEVDIHSLKEQGIKVFICDLDNTLVPHYRKLPTKEVIQFIRNIEKIGMKFVLVSNNIKKRVELFAEKAHVKTWYANAKKPLKKVILDILKKNDVSPKEAIILGDQLITDVLVANRAGIESILVQPMVSTDSEMTKFNLILEKYIYRKLEKQNILRQGVYWSGNEQVSYDLL